jgi:hypothetical protein
MSLKKSELKDSSSRTEIHIDPSPAKVETKVSSRGRAADMDAMYSILGLVAQAEKYMKHYKGSQLARRDLRIRARQEIHLLQVHATTVMREMLQAAQAISRLETQEREAIAAARKNFQEISVLLEDDAVAKYYDVDHIEGFLEGLEAHKSEPTRDISDLVAQLEQLQLREPQVLLVETNTLADYEAVKLACLNPLVAMEGRMARKHKKTKNS